MDDQKARYEERLRRIILHSADVLPEEVTKYLAGVSVRPGTEPAHQALRDFKCLVDSIPKQYTDFVISVLLLPEDAEDYGAHSPRDRLLGIRDVRDFSPESHLRGPFLYLLRKNEEQGIRLVQHLSNAAVRHWVQREQSAYAASYIGQQPVTPLPILIDWPSGQTSVWGDDNVYRWFRPNSNGPSPVKSALMALEVWMDEQLNTGRDALELFETVQRGSECVAIAGICLGAAMARKSECLEAALSLVKSPQVWRLDISRLNSEQQKIPTFDFFGRDRDITMAREELDNWPQRHVYIGDYVQLYLSASDSHLGDDVRAAVTTFTDNLPFLFEEEKLDPEYLEVMKAGVAKWPEALDRKSDRTSGNEVESVQPKPPVRDAGRDDEEKADRIRKVVWGLRHRATVVLGRGEPFPSIPPNDAVAWAMELIQLLQSSDQDLFDISRTEAIEAVVATVAAILSADCEWAEEADVIPWCRDVLLSVVNVGRDPRGTVAVLSRYPMDRNVSAARGLAALVVLGHGDATIREAILGLMIDSQHQVVSAVMYGLRAAWLKEPVLCANALALGLSLCLVPRRAPQTWYGGAGGSRAQWLNRLVRKHLKQVRDGRLPELPRIVEDDEHRFRWDVAQHVLSGLPVRRDAMKEGIRGQFVQCVYDLVKWTVSANASVEDDDISDCPPFEWNAFFTEWLGTLPDMLSANEIKDYIVQPVMASLHETAELAAGLVYGFVRHQLVKDTLLPEAEAAWREMCLEILGKVKLPEWEPGHRYYLDQDLERALSGMVYVSYGICSFNERWPYARRFEDLTDRWVRQFGHDPNLFRALLEMLKEPGRVFFPEPALDWLTTIMRNAQDMHSLWEESSNGLILGELLHNVWKHRRDEVKASPDSVKRFAEIVDVLVAAGIRIAAVLQSELGSS